MELLVKLLSTFAAGAVWLWWAIPTGIVMDLSPLLSGAAATLGNLGAVLFIVVLNEQSRRWFVHYRLVTKQGERLKRVWSSYGLPGVALLSPPYGGAFGDRSSPPFWRSSASAIVLDGIERGALGRRPDRGRYLWVVGAWRLANIRRKSHPLNPPRRGVLRRPHSPGHSSCPYSRTT
jgi:hypothetical protein